MKRAMKNLDVKMRLQWFGAENLGMAAGNRIWIENVLSRRQMSARLTEPVRCHVLKALQEVADKMKSKKTDKGGYLVQALLCDETYFIPALFSEDCLKDFQQPTEGSILDLEGKYIDLKDYNIYPVLSNEQDKCELVLYVEKFDAAGECSRNQISRDLVCSTKNEEIKKRLRYLWRLNQLRKEGNARLDGENSLAKLEILQYSKTISNEDKEKLAEVKALQESTKISKSLTLPQRERSGDDQCRSSNKSIRNELQISPCAEKAFVKVSASHESPNKLNSDVNTDKMIAKAVDAEDGDSRYETGLTLQESNARDMLRGNVNDDGDSCAKDGQLSVEMTSKKELSETNIELPATTNKAVMMDENSPPTTDDIYNGKHSPLLISSSSSSSSSANEKSMTLGNGFDHRSTPSSLLDSHHLSTSAKQLLQTSCIEPAFKITSTKINDSQETEFFSVIESQELQNTGRQDKEIASPLRDKNPQGENYSKMEPKEASPTRILQHGPGDAKAAKETINDVRIDTQSNVITSSTHSIQDLQKSKAHRGTEQRQKYETCFNTTWPSEALQESVTHFWREAYLKRKRKIDVKKQLQLFKKFHPQATI